MDSATSSHERHFHPIDYVLFIFVLTVSLAIGAIFTYRGRKKNTTDEYLMGSKKLTLLSVTLSMTVSVVSSNTLLGAPAEMYNYGMMFGLMAISYFLSGIILAVWIVPFFYQFKLTSINKYLYLRFHSKGVQWAGTFIQLLPQVFYVACVIYGPSTALQAVTGLPHWISLLLMIVIGTSYTALGGMKAVVWTDVFQSLVMVTGLIAIIVEGSRNVGGFGKVWQSNLENGRLEVNLKVGPSERFDLCSLILGYGCEIVAVFGIYQPCFQRYSSLKSLTQAQLAVLLTAPATTIFVVLSMMTGMVAFAYYDLIGCDPIDAGLILNANQIIPYFVMEILNKPGIPGIFIASLFCASLSSLSSSINSMTAILWEDVLQDHFHHISERRKMAIMKVISVLFSILCLAVSFIVMYIRGNLIQGAISGAVIGLGINTWLLAGQIYYKMQQKQLPTRIDGCFAGLYNATTTNPSVWTNASDISLSTQCPSEMVGFLSVYSISFAWFPLIGFLLVFLMGMLISALTGVFIHQKVQKNLVFPCVVCCHNNIRRSSDYELPKFHDANKMNLPEA